MNTQWSMEERYLWNWVRQNLLFTSFTGMKDVLGLLIPEISFFHDPNWLFITGCYRLYPFLHEWSTGKPNLCHSLILKQFKSAASNFQQWKLLDCTFGWRSKIFSPAKRQQFLKIQWSSWDPWNLSLGCCFNPYGKFSIARIQGLGKYK